MHQLLFLLLTLSGMLQAQKTTIDVSVFNEIFGTPPTNMQTSGPTTPRLEDITIRPTDASTTFTDKNGEACKCVPYYLCDSNLVGVDANNKSVTGYFELDIRFKEDECQESVERCCTNPKNEEEVPPVPTPDPTKLKGCGYRNPKGLDFTITGGNGAEAQFGEFPWVVALMDAKNESYAGVGVLIHPEVVMTGAHIAFKYMPGTLKVRAGEWDTQTTKERLQYQERIVKDIYIHSGFRSKSLWNDVALLRLQEPVQLSDHINVICMPRQEENFDASKNCIANGWGKNHFGVQGRYAVILKKVEVNMVNHARCTTLLQRTRLGRRFQLHTSFVCAGGEEGKDTCQGDGGAPLACPIGEDRYKLTGLVAWGIGCGQKDVPAAYVAVPQFRDWVDQKMEEWGYDTSGYNID